MTADTTSASGSTVAQTEFVTREFETSVTDEDRERVIEAIATAVSNLREQIADDRLEKLLRAESGNTVLKTEHTHENQKPESLTQQAVIEVLFEALGYDDLPTEAGSYSEDRSKIADYSMPFDMNGESNRLLIEAEPIGKNLDSRKHGIGQVKDWLSRREFESDFGFATDGLRWVFVRYDSVAYKSNIIEDIDLRPVFVTAFENAAVGKESITEALSETDHEAIDGLIQTFERENFVSIASDARRIIGDAQEAITDEFYEEYIRYVFGITEDEEQSARSLIREGIVAPDGATGDDVRLFAVELMNRLLFIKFLEDRGVVRADLLRTLRETYDDGMYMTSFYKAFLEPLFYGVFDTKPDDRSEQIGSRELFADIPYLNGGLFRPQVGGGEEFDEIDFEVSDTVLTDIIDLLERYEFSAEGKPTALDPSILGNVFEKTINHITTDSGDKNKELGAYYTPDEITQFCAERTVQPGLRDRFLTVLMEEWGWTEAMAEKYDDLDDLIDGLPASADIADDLLNEVDSFRALDPACGSGHFLTSVLGEIVAIRKSLHALRGDNPDDWQLKKRTVTQNVYGVDIVEPAVEIAKLRLWLSIIAEVDPEAMEEYDEDDLALPNVVFNVRQGNSLIGFTDLMETKGEENDDGSQQAALTSWGPDSVRAKYGNVISLVTKHKRATETDEAMKYLREAEALLEDYREDLDEKVLQEFHEAGVEDVTPEQVRSYEPFHWVLEFATVYADGGFDVVVGNPPWDVLRVDREDYFVRFDKEFRTKSITQREAAIEQLLEEDYISEGWEEYKREMQMRADYFNRSGEYTLQSPTVDGRKVTTENELSALFLERTFEIARQDGHVSFILPNVIFVGAAGKDLRNHLLEKTRTDLVIHFENRGIFEGLDSRYRFGILNFKNSGQTNRIRGIFSETSLDVLDCIEDRTATIPREVLDEYSPKALSFPQVSVRWKQHENADPQYTVGILKKFLSYPAINNNIEGKWKAVPHRELDRSYDTDRFIEHENEGDYPVYGGKNIYQYTYDHSFLDVMPPELWSVSEEKNPEISAKSRIRQKEVRNLKAELYHTFEGTGSQKQFVNQLLEENRGKPLSEEDVVIDCTQPRIVFRDITHSTNERTFVAAVIPKGIVCHSKLRTIRPYQIKPDRDDLTEEKLSSVYQSVFTDRELFTTLGLLNSLPFDHLMRIKIYTTISGYKFKESQMPRLTDGDDWFHYISERAARINCYGEAFAEMRKRLGGIESATEETERRRLQAEIDAAAFHAYGLDREETKFVLDDFHRVRNPRMMDEAYFDSVLEYYDNLAERGPMP